MTTSVLPRSAVDLCGNGAPWYPFQESHGGEVLFWDRPRLEVATHRWADLPDGWADLPHIDLDRLHLAQLLFVADCATDSIDLEFLLGVLDRQLHECRCDVDRLMTRMSSEYGDHDQFPMFRMARCVRAADLWLDVR